MTRTHHLTTDRPVAELRRAVKRYGAVTALAGIDFEVRPGEVVALLGPNGAGKTTAVQLLLGLVRPSAGEARLFGVEPRARRGAGAHRRHAPGLQGARDPQGARARRPRLQLLPPSPPRGRGDGGGRARGDRGPPVRQALRRPAPARALRPRPVRRSRPAVPRRAHGRARRRGPARLLVGDRGQGRARGGRCCSPPTTWRRRTPSPTASS